MLVRLKAVLYLTAITSAGCAVSPSGPPAPIEQIRTSPVKELGRPQPMSVVDAEPITDPAKSVERCRVYSALVIEYSNSVQEILVNPNFKDLSVATWRSYFGENLNRHLSTCLGAIPDVLFQNRSKLSDVSRRQLSAVVLDINQSTATHLADYHTRLVDRVIQTGVRVPVAACDDEFQIIDSLLGKGIIGVGDRVFDQRASGLTSCLMSKRGIQ